jgi:F-type H+-transporting ATPase subunit delta
MANTSVLAHRYAVGLLRVAKGIDQLDPICMELQSFLAAFQSDPSLREVMLNPAYSARARREVLEDLVPKLNLSQPVANLLRLLILKRRFQNLPEIVAAFEDLHRNERGILRAEVTVATDLDETMRQRVEDVVAQLTGKTPELSVQTDPALLGGIKIRMGNTILDASIKTKLERLRERLIEPTLTVQS